MQCFAYVPADLITFFISFYLIVLSFIQVNGNAMNTEYLPAFCIYSDLNGNTMKHCVCCTDFLIILIHVSSMQNHIVYSLDEVAVVLLN